MKNTQNNNSNDSEQPLVEHLIELRSRLIRVALGIALILACLLPFAQKIYTLIALPLLKSMPTGNTMIATDVISPFFVPLKVTLLAAFVLSLPHTLYHLWAFVAPALYKHEKRLVFPLLISSVLLFFIGMAFAYFLVFPTVFGFMQRISPEGVNMATDIDKYLSFVLGMFIAFGAAFEVPVAVVLLHRFGLISLKTLKAARPYVVIAAFVIAAIITPPDVISQIMLAIPLLLLYEFGLIACKIFRRKEDSETE
ncbi:MAG: twin-arginine translocase subunit TatC [Neisseriaceae bacterium]|nr:twin-arginine translocase subunit TatC [Neisseriaceae bacterium]